MLLFRSRFARLLLLAAFAIGLIGQVHAADSLQDISKLLKQGHQTQALEQVDKYLVGKPKDAQGRFLKGLILTELNRPTEAIAVFQKLTEDYPELPEPYNNLAVIYAQLKQYDKARQALEMAIRTHPSYATAHENLGDIYARMASQAYDKALQLDSSNTSAQTKLSMIRDLMGNGRQTKAAAGGPVVVASNDAPATTDSKPAEAKALPAAKSVEVRPIEPTKPIETKPVETKPATKAGNATAEARKAVEAWTSAWSRKDVAAYIGSYAKDFQTPGGMGRPAWEAERRQRLTKPGAIEVSAEGLRIAADGPDHVTAQFRQHYKSANLKTSSNKTLVLVRQDGNWLIQQEKVGR